MDKDKKSKKSKSTEKAIGKPYSMYSHTDPNGSYTGVPKNKDDKPVQDADDL